jgi:hypothetical protein
VSARDGRTLSFTYQCLPVTGGRLVSVSARYFMKINWFIYFTVELRQSMILIEQSNNLNARRSRIIISRFRCVLTFGLMLQAIKVTSITIESVIDTTTVMLTLASWFGVLVLVEKYVLFWWWKRSEWWMVCTEVAALKCTMIRAISIFAIAIDNQNTLIEVKETKLVLPTNWELRIETRRWCITMNIIIMLVVCWIGWTALFM